MMNKHANATTPRGNPAVTQSGRYRSLQRAQRAYAQFLDLGIPRVHLLLTGSDAVTRELVAALRPHLRSPVVSWQRGMPLRLPPASAGTLILREVGTLRSIQQRRLADWLTRANDAQVVCTTSRPLVPAVESGRFSATLYYRLNIVLIDAGG